jgi:hypothetical protein
VGGLNVSKKNHRQAIVIIHPRIGSTVWLEECLKSIKTDYPILISNHEGWVMEGVKKMWQTTRYEELFFMNESMICKDNSVWDLVFRHHGGKSVCMSERYLMFFGKFRREMVNRLEFPAVHTKLDDVFLGEGQWCRQYYELGDHVEIDPLADGDTTDKSRFVEKHGRRNLVLENRYFIKFKQSYDMTTLLANQ